MKIYNKRSPQRAAKDVPTTEQVLEQVSRQASRQASQALEFAFAQMLSPKQKELFLRKLKGDTLSKTDREYYSRVVRKKILALANADLHQLARKALEVSTHG
ncbi:MAG: hypothetical protein WCO69_00710 [Candidatus Omnitrophota bacterium]